MLENRNNFLISSRPKIVVVVQLDEQAKEAFENWARAVLSVLVFRRKFHVELGNGSVNLVPDQSYVRKTLVPSIFRVQKPVENI